MTWSEVKRKSEEEEKKREEAHAKPRRKRRREGREEKEAFLALRMIESLADNPDSEIEALWIEEAERRLDELDRGPATAMPAEEVLRRAREAIT